MKIVADDEGTLHAKQGSQAVTRLLGGWFVNSAKLPKAVTIAFSPSGEATEVTAHIEESLGFGLLDPKFKKKYETYFASWMTGLRSALT